MDSEQGNAQDQPSSRPDSKVSWFRQQLSLEHFSLFRHDTRTLVGALMLGAVFTLMEQFMERLDTILTGGSLPWFGLAIGPVFMVLSAWLFGFWGGQIAGNFNPVFAVLTATNPIAPMFFLFNISSMALLAVLIHVYKQRGNDSVAFPTFFTLTFISMQCITGLILLLWTLVLQLPTEVVVVYFLLLEVALIVLSVTSWFAFRGVIKSQVIE